MRQKRKKGIDQTEILKIKTWLQDDDSINNL